MSGKLNNIEDKVINNICRDRTVLYRQWFIHRSCLLALRLVVDEHDPFVFHQ